MSELLFSIMFALMWIFLCLGYLIGRKTEKWWVKNPTPAELAQQLADLTGNAVVVYRQPEGHWMGCIFEDTCNIHDLPFRQGGEDPDNESWCDMGAFGEFFINRPINYTGRWQDSKVTAGPKGAD